jgi:signal transduction histidine kinase/CheY-like chemotaxis protein
LKDGEFMKLSLKKTKQNNMIDHHLMSFEVINQTYVMLSKKLANYLTLNQQLTTDKFLSLFNAEDQPEITQILENKHRKSTSIFILKNHQIIRIIYYADQQYGYMIPVDDIKDYLDEIEQLKRDLRAKDSFIYEMSHELKTPLQTLVSTIDLLENEISIDHRKSLIHDMSLALDQAVNSTNNILNLSKLQYENYQLQKDIISIKAFISDIHHIFKTSLDQKNLYFKMTHYKDINIVSDESLLKQVLTNIISNAIKFTQEGGLYVETDVTEDKQLKITVEDTGIGMTDEELKRMFKPFSQANKEISKRYGGTGLGLSITRKILSLMNGHIEISSTYGSGTKIIITCPIEISKEKMISKQDDAVTIPKGLNILIAEDNTLSLKATKQLLENIGLNVEVAKNGIEVLNQYKDYPFNLILMDVSMPKMDGFEATKHLREQDQNIPIIAMTANTYDEHIKACFAAGMTDILYKPFKAKDLYKMIDKHTK